MSTNVLKNSSVFLNPETDVTGSLATSALQNEGYKRLLVVFDRNYAISSVKASGFITVAGTATNGHTLTINGTVFTFATSPSGASQIGLGSSAANLASLIQAALAASVDTNVVKATYTLHPGTPTRIDIIDNTPGTSGNSFTLATNETNLTLSGATLSGGTGSLVTADLSYEIYNPILGDWHTVPILADNNTTGLFYILLGGDTLPDLTYPTGSTGSKVLVPVVDTYRFTIVPDDLTIPYNIGLAVYNIL